MGAPTVSTVRVLHTADWHVGKNPQGPQPARRAGAGAREIVRIAREQRGRRGARRRRPVRHARRRRADAQQLVVPAPAGAGADRRARSSRSPGTTTTPPPSTRTGPFAGAAGITLVGSVRDGRRPAAWSSSPPGRPASGSTVAVLPFLSQRYAVRAAELVAPTPAENTSDYDEHGPRGPGQRSPTGSPPDAVNVVMAHLTVLGGKFGGGERAAQSIFEYRVPAAVFPAEAHYVALGHLHRRQTLPAPCPVHYCGAPLAVDFGEQDNTPVVCWSRPRPARPPRSPTSRSRPAGGCARCTARSPNWSARGRRSATTCSASACASPPGPGCARRSRSCCRTRWRCGSTRSSPQRSPRARPRTGADRSPGELFAEYCGTRAASTTGGSRRCSRSCTTGSRMSGRG